MVTAGVACGRSGRGLAVAGRGLSVSEFLIRPW